MIQNYIQDRQRRRSNRERLNRHIYNLSKFHQPQNPRMLPVKNHKRAMVLWNSISESKKKSGSNREICTKQPNLQSVKVLSATKLSDITYQESTLYNFSISNKNENISQDKRKSRPTNTQGILKHEIPKHFKENFPKRKTSLT